MIDAHTGTLTFERPPATIGRSLTRDEFLRSPLAEGATTFVANEPHHAWKLAGTFRSCELDMLVVLHFSAQQLTMVSMSNPDPRFGTSWDDHSREKEMARKAAHDTWLARALPSPPDVSWGSVVSVFDEKTGGSAIVVRYEAHGEARRA